MSGRAFLADFGLAKNVTTGSRYTRTGATLGTPAYMSPEQARGEVAELTAASDAWALACVTYQLVTGRSPFDDDAPAAIVGRVLTHTPPTLHALGFRGVPRALDVALRNALLRPVERRTPNAGAFRDELAAALAGAAVVSRQPRRVGAWLFGGAIAAAVLAAAALALVGPSGRPDPADATGPVGAMERARALARQGWEERLADPAKSEALLRQAIQLTPDQHEWRVQHGVVLWQLGRRVDADATWAGVPETSPERARATMYRALMRQCDPGAPELRGGIDELVAAAADDPGPAGVLARTLRLRRQRDIDGALAELADAEGWEAALLRTHIHTGHDRFAPAEQLRAADAAIGSGLRFAWIHISRGIALARLKELEAANDAFALALEIDPDNASALANRGSVFMDMDRFPEARRDLLAAQAINPNDTGALYGLAELHAKKEEFAEAIALYDRLIALNPLEAKLWCNRGRIRLVSNDVVGAETDLAETLRLEPDHPLGLIYMGSVRRRQGRFAESVAAYDRYLEVHPPTAQAYNRRGYAKHVSGDLQGALPDYDRALDIDGDALTYIQRGALYKEMGRLDLALKDLGLALDTNPKLIDAWVNRGQLHGAMGNLREAIADFRQALKLRPQLAGVETMLGYTLMQLGDYVPASEAFERALAIDPDDPLADVAREQLATCKQLLQKGR